MNVPNVSHLNYKLTLDVRKMIQSDTSISSTSLSAESIMRECRSKLKNRAILLNRTELSPILPIQTR